MAGSIEIDFFRPEDAPGVARLFREVYGEGYPVRTYYLPEKLIEENAAGRILSSVARTSGGEVVGHDALVLLDSEARVYENAAGAVLQAARGQGVFFRLFEHSVRDAAQHYGVEEVLGEPVCNHLHLQKMCLKLGYRESGLEVDLMPATAYTAEKSATGRVSVLLGFFAHRPEGDPPVYLPSAYGPELEYLYAGLGGERSFIRAPEGLPTAAESRGRMEVFAGAQVARFAIQQVGSDFDAFMGRLEREARDQGVAVFQVWLPLTSASTESATNLLRAKGYFIGGIVPRWLDRDTLLLQKATGRPDWEGIQLYSERSRKIGEIVRRDWERTT